MTTYVLVHGSWHGGWYWRSVGQILIANGDTVYMPTLTGLGERAHLLSPDTSLELHINDIMEQLESEDLERVILVGHGHGGVVVSAAADRAAERITRLVYLDAVVPGDGECMYDSAPAQIRTFFEAQAKTGGDGWRVPASAVSAEFLGLVDAEDIRWVIPKLTAHPIRTFREPVRLSAGFLDAAHLYQLHRR